MNQRSSRFRGLALLLALVVSGPTWAATPTVAPQLPDPGSVGISKQRTHSSQCAAEGSAPGPESSPSPERLWTPGLRRQGTFSLF